MSDTENRDRIWAQIDSISGEAAKFAIANEYDKMVSGLGAKGTNAYTSNEKTVYINDIPSKLYGGKILSTSCIHLSPAQQSMRNR